MGFDKFYMQHKKDVDQELESLKPRLLEQYKKNGIMGAVGFVYAVSDALMKQVDADGRTICSKGCSFCCSGDIPVSSSEASIIISYIKRDNIKIDYSQLTKQKNKSIDKLKFADKKCSLLDKAGLCSIYEYRPVVCRTFNSSDTDPEFCNKDKHPKPNNMGLSALMVALNFALFWLDDTILNVDESYTVHGALNYIFGDKKTHYKTK
jgi:Fe-S-cluster containining protein